MEEYYIKHSESDEARGPYTLAALKELVANGNLKRTAYYYDEDKDAFVSFEDTPDLWHQIQPPPKVGLKLKRTTPVPVPESTPGTEDPSGKSLQKTPAPAAPEKSTGMEESIDLNQVFASAEGKTPGTRHTRRPARTQHWAASILLPGLVLAMLAFVGSLVYAYFDPLSEMVKNTDYSPGILLDNWILFFALVDFLLLLVIGLGQTGVFPFLRFRAALGLGFFGYVLYSLQAWEALAAISAYQAGLIGATLMARFLPTLCILLVAIGGSGYFGYLIWDGAILFIASGS